MRIVVHGQQAFGKAVLEALIKRGENVVGVYVAPEKPGQKADPLKEAALAAKLEDLLTTPTALTAAAAAARRLGIADAASRLADLVLACANANDPRENAA